MNQYIAQVPARQANYEQKMEKALTKAFPPWLLVSMGLAFIFFMVVSALSKKKNVLAWARFANKGEIRKMQKVVRRQQAKRVYNDFALRFGTNHKYGVPQVGPAIAIIGQSGCGKTADFVDPMIQDAIDQEATILVYDAKGVQARRHLAYALSKDYFGKVFAPGRRYSKDIQATINMLDFLKGDKADLMAYQLGNVINMNFSERLTSRDPYFGPQGDALLQTIFMMASLMPYPDMLTAWSLLSLPGLAKRFHIGLTAQDILSQMPDFPFPELLFDSRFMWALQKAMGLISVHEADQTSGGIVSSAVTQYQKIISPSFLPHLLETNIPLDLNGKQIIFFEPDMEAPEATTPLCAAAIHMLVERNTTIAANRDRPIFLFLDEFTSANFPKLDSWAALKREQGLVTVLGYQCDAQTIERYGRERADSITSNAPTKIYMRPGHDATAKRISSALGEKEVRYIETSGGKTQKHRSKAPLMSPQDVDSMERGEAVIYSPLLKHPWHLTAHYDSSDFMVQRYKKCESIFNSRLADSSDSELPAPKEIDDALEIRSIIAKGYLPSPDDLKSFKQVKDAERKKSSKDNSTQKSGLLPQSLIDFYSQEPASQQHQTMGQNQ